MQKVTEQQIQAMAPNAAAASNGKKISQKGGFVRLECSGDGTFYLGECTGSGKSNYITSVDFIEPDAPVCRCSCPSRQFPCKHGLALLYEIAAGKAFGLCEIPEDIQKKRAKRQGKKDEAENDASLGGAQAVLTEEEAAKKRAAAAKSAKAARTKKLKKQLEGLTLTSRLVQELLKAGLGTMGGTALKTYEQLSKQLGDFYLPGPQRLLNGLILEIAAYQKDGREEHYENAISILEKLWTLVKKSEQYLNDKLEKGEEAQDDSELYEELGGIWKLSELEALGKTLNDAELMQLSFWCTYDEARKEYIDTGCWVDMADGKLYMTYNYRPLKALKYVKQDDTAFGVAHAASAACYPGQGNPRIRWNSAQFRETTDGDFQKIRGMAAHSLAAEAKNAKNILKNALADPLSMALLSYQELARMTKAADGSGSITYVLKNEAGETVQLGDAPGMEPSTERLSLLPDGSLLKNQTMLGAFYYDAPERRLKLQPLSIITENAVIRFLY